MKTILHHHRHVSLVLSSLLRRCVRLALAVQPSENGGKRRGYEEDRGQGLGAEGWGLIKKEEQQRRNIYVILNEA